MHRDASPILKREDWFLQEGNRAHRLPAPLQELLSPLRCQPRHRGSRVALLSSPLPFKPQFSHLENGDNVDTHLAVWLRSKWDDGRARGSGFKVSIKDLFCI